MNADYVKVVRILKLLVLILNRRFDIMINMDRLTESFFMWQTDISALEQHTQLTEAVQLAVMAATLGSATCTRFPPRLDFRLSFCKKLIKAAEATEGGSAAEPLYEMLAQLQQEKSAGPGYRTYFVNNNSISIRETREIIR